MANLKHSLSNAEYTVLKVINIMNETEVETTDENILFASSHLSIRPSVIERSLESLITHRFVFRNTSGLIKFRDKGFNYLVYRNSSTEPRDSLMSVLQQRSRFLKSLMVSEPKDAYLLSKNHNKESVDTLLFLQNARRRSTV